MSFKRSTEVQSVLVPREKGVRGARQWAKKAGFAVQKVDVPASGKYVRLRQHPPSSYRKGSMRTISLGGGAKAVIGKRKNPSVDDIRGGLGTDGSLWIVYVVDWSTGKTARYADAYGRKSAASWMKKAKKDGHTKVWKVPARLTLDGMEPVKGNPSSRGRKNPLHLPGGFEDPDKYIIGHGIPKSLRGTVPNVDPQGTDLSIWRWTENGKLYAIAFQARSTKPLWYHRFRDAEQMENKIQGSIRARLSSLEGKEKRAAEKREYVSSAKAGDIYYSSGGYDQTNVSFFQITKVSGKSAYIRPVAKKVVREERGADYVSAVSGKYVGPEQRVVLTPNGFKVGYKYASPWDGRPKYETALGWGH